MEPFHRQGQAHKLKNVTGYVNGCRVPFNEFDLVTQLLIMVTKFQQHCLLGINRLIILIEAPVAGLLHGTNNVKSQAESSSLTYRE